MPAPRRGPGADPAATSALGPARGDPAATSALRPAGATRADLWPAAPANRVPPLPFGTRTPAGNAPANGVPPVPFGSGGGRPDGVEEPDRPDYSTGVFSRVLLTGLGGSAEPEAPPPAPAPAGPPGAKDKAVATTRRLAARVGALRGDEKTAVLAVAAVVGVVLLMFAALIVVVRLTGGGDHPTPAGAVAPSPTLAASPAGSATPSGTDAPTPSDAPSGSPLPPSGGSFTSRHSGLCLAAPQGRTDAGAQLVQRTCGTDFGTGFLLVAKDQPGTYQLVSSATSLCVDVLNASTDDGAPVVQWDCNGGANETFLLRPLTDAAGTDTGYVQIVAAHSGKCFDVTAISADQNAPIQQYTCRDPAAEIDPAAGNQSWQFTAD